MASPVRAKDWVVKSAHRPNRSERPKGAYGSLAKRDVGDPPSGVSSLSPEDGGGGPHEEVLVGT